jgi:hypothetical protein
MLSLLAQLDCSIEMVAVAPAEGTPTPPSQRPAAIEHVIEFQNALSGESLSVADVASLTPVASMSGDVLQAPVAERSADGVALRRAWVIAPTGETYTLRIDGNDSRNYFGCERTFPVAGTPSRAVRVALVPRTRDLSIDVAITRGAHTRPLTASGVRAIELRPAASAEREVELHEGRCTGERPNEGSHWCVRTLAAAPTTFALSVMTPGYGLTTVAVDPRAAERTIALTARYEGHFMPATTWRIGALVGALNGNGIGAFGSLDVLPSSTVHAETCPLAAFCVRPTVHVAGGSVPYARETVLVGPGATSTADTEVHGDLTFFEIGGGVTIVPPGMGDGLRASLVAAALLANRGDEFTNQNTLLLSSATARLGLSTELTAAWRFAGPLQLFAGARLHWVPSFGRLGRRFSFLGDAPVTTESAALLQVAVHGGLGLEL